MNSIHIFYLLFCFFFHCTTIDRFTSNMSASIKVAPSNIRVSSVLNRDTKQFGKQYLVDTDDDTCWNSDQGSPQLIQVDFERVVTLDEVHIQFQGGFAGNQCLLEGKRDTADGYTRIQEFYPEDVNSVQVFKLQQSESVKMLKLVFNNSTDFFGRITIYKLDIKGRES